MPMTIDITPSWGEVGLIVKRLAFSGEEKALNHIWPEAARAFAFAQALHVLLPSLTEEQLAFVSQTSDAELLKQGYDPAKKGGN